MRSAPTPILDPRDALRVLAELLARRPGYLPAWEPAAGGPGHALLEIFARYNEIVIGRLNQAPDKNLLAFLDTLGLSLIPAQPARAPVVFTPLPGVNGRVGTRTRLGAEGENGEPVYFETESSIAVAGARLAEVRTLWPARDQVADHSLQAAGGRPFTLFEGLEAVPHELYIAHNTLFALAGASTVEIEFELITPGNQPFEAVTWQFWDGEIWRPFRAFDPSDETASIDGTAGFTKSGVVTLRLECGEAQKRIVQGIEAFWICARLDEPLPPDPARVLPEIDRLRTRSVIERPALAAEVDVSEISTPGRIEVSVTDPKREAFPGLRIRLVQMIVFEGPPLTLYGQTDEEGRVVFEGVQAQQWVVQINDPTLPRVSQQVTLFEGSGRAVDFSINSLGLAPDQAFADGLELDVSKPFQPLGPQPQPGNVFYLACEELMTKPGAKATVLAKLLDYPTPAGDVNSLTPPDVHWEYWNGSRWARLAVNTPASSPDPIHFRGDGSFSFILPADLEPVEVNEETGLWLRARLLGGGYGFRRTISWTDSEAQPSVTNRIRVIETEPPVVLDLRLGYSYRSPWERPEHVMTHNDFAFQVRSDDVRWPGQAFAPFRPMSDVSPTLYLGFERPLPNDRVSLFVDVEERQESTPSLIWEAWNGEGWRELRVDDETDHLQLPGMVSFIAPDVASRPSASLGLAEAQTLILPDAFEAAAFQTGDEIVVREDPQAEGELARIASTDGHTFTLETPLETPLGRGQIQRAALPRFGSSRDWIRARLAADGAPARSQVQGLHLNATWAMQVETVEDEILGSANGQPNQSLFFTRIPVLPGEEIEVLELVGERAAVEEPVLREELLAQGMSEDDLRTRSDPRTGRINEVWVRWQYRPQLFFSGPGDRHYTVERARGRLIFGNGQNGRLPPILPNNIRARRYRAGGGLAGNVGPEAINQLLGTAPGVQAVMNPVSADGGADGETPEQVKTRGPETVRHLGRSVAARDYEALAREASPGVAAVRALPATAPNGLPAPGWVTVILVPQSLEPRPQPSFELRRRVHAHLAARAPATLAPERIAVIGPTYFELGVAVQVVPNQAGEAGLVEQRLRDALNAFLHPLTGGPEGVGWPLGRDAYLSDFAALIESVEGVDHAEDLNLLVDETPRGEVVRVPPDRMVVAGKLSIEMKGGS